MNPYCKTSEFASWHQWQSGFALGRSAKASGAAISVRFVSIPFQRGFYEGYHASLT